MSTFSEGDEVLVKSLNVSRELVGLCGNMIAGQVITVAVVCRDRIQADNDSWYAIEDLELVGEKEDPVEEAPVLALTLDDVDTGDTVELVSLEKSSMQFGPYCECIGHTFTVAAKDTSDNSVLSGDGDWYFISDLKLVEEVSAPLALDDVHVNDEVRIVSLDYTKGRLNLDNGMHGLGATFVIGHLDFDDDTVQDLNTHYWYAIEDLELVKGTVETPTPTEVPAERDVNFLITRDSVSLTINGDTEVATKDHKNFDTIRENVLNDDFDEAMALMNVAVGIANWGQGSLQIDGGKVLYVGMELTGKLVDRIIGMMGDDDNEFEKFAKFLCLVMEQESFKTRARLMDFAAHDKLDIDENGFIVAFKNVRSDYFDKHSGTFRNMVGDEPSLRRSDVNDDHDVSCSAGLHVCSPTYLKGFWGTSGRTMRVVVDPRDMVAVPYDYADSKARVCKYRVVEDVTDNIKDYLS